VIGMESPFRYRNKIQLPVGEKDNKLITGFYQERSHRIIESKEPCNVQDELMDDIVKTIIEAANTYGIKAYNESEHEGTLRHIVVRTGKETKEAMIVLVTRTEELPHKEEIINKITEKLPYVKSIIQN